MSEFLYADLEETRESYKASLAQLEERVKVAAKAEADYQSAKARRALEMKAEKETMTMIQMRIKGDSEVNDKLFQRDCSLGLLDATIRAIDMYKLDARLIEKQIEREYGGCYAY